MGTVYDDKTQVYYPMFIQGKNEHNRYFLNRNIEVETLLNNKSNNIQKVALK